VKYIDGGAASTGTSEFWISLLRGSLMRIAIAVIAVCFCLGDDTDSAAVKKDMAQLEGEWSMVSGERDGQELPDEILKGAKRVSKAGETTVTIDGQPFMQAKYTVDPGKKPKTIDYTLTGGPNTGKNQLGIYELDGETVKFCFSAPGEPRPTEFKTMEGSTRTLSVWKRDKK
jgi:uncharacterized protein (TIGR03067 family)